MTTPSLAILVVLFLLSCGGPVSKNNDPSNNSNSNVNGTTNNANSTTNSANNPQTTVDPCDGKMCGDSCSTCFDTVCPTVEEYCQPDGSCSSNATPICGDYEPCGGKMCGDPCTICAPGDPECGETTVEKFCTPDAECIAGPAAC